MVVKYMNKKLARALPRIGTFIPTMQPMYADYKEVMEAHGGKTFSEIKYDGYRVQIHKSGRGLKVFTRNGNELNYACYPEIVKIAESLPQCILEAELVGEGNGHKEVFDNVKKRFRRAGISDKSLEKYLTSGVVEGTPLSLRVFDTIRFEKRGTLYLPLSERRAYTERFDSTGIVPSEIEVVEGVDALEELVVSSFGEKQEGRVCKNPSSQYVPGGNTIDWVKFKRSEPLDLVVIGVYTADYGRDLPFTSVLCATYNDETGKYETIGKIGATRNGLANEINALIGDKLQNARPGNVVVSEKLDRDAFSKYVPDLYVDPESSAVLEVKAMNLNYSNNWQTCGLDEGRAFSMRIGFANQVRYDKGPRQATKTSAVRTLYRLQEGSK
jgi:DNA ligase 1